MALIVVPAQARVGISLPPASAQVNACDSVNHQLGVRATMPGGGADEQMFTRFSTQWVRPSTNAWEALPGSESPWIPAGPGPWIYKTSGFTRTFAPAPAGVHFTLRGTVEMQWRGPHGTRTKTVVSGPCTLN
jgi:hypothetical protein